MSKLSRFIDRNQLKVRKAAWRLRHGRPGARAIFILGAQRSGTTMLIGCLNQSLELEVFGEASRAMQNWRIKDSVTIRKMIDASRHRAVIFKPLTDSHRGRELLSLVENSGAIWAYRRAADRANSAVARFGTNNLEHLSAFARGERLDTWQAAGMSEASLALLKRFDFAKVTPHSAAGLFWYIRNSLFFEQGLDQDPRVLPLAYEDLVTTPDVVMRGVCKFVGCSYEPAIHRSIHARSLGRAESKLSPEVDELCDAMYARLKRVQDERWQALGLLTQEGTTPATRVDRASPAGPS
jgi:hypothetical protein